MVVKFAKRFCGGLPGWSVCFPGKQVDFVTPPARSKDKDCLPFRLFFWRRRPAACRLAGSRPAVRERRTAASWQPQAVHRFTGGGRLPAGRLPVGGSRHAAAGRVRDGHAKMTTSKKNTAAACVTKPRRQRFLFKNFSTSPVDGLFLIQWPFLPFRPKNANFGVLSALAANLTTYHPPHTVF